MATFCDVKDCVMRAVDKVGSESSFENYHDSETIDVCQNHTNLFNSFLKNLKSGKAKLE